MPSPRSSRTCDFAGCTQKHYGRGWCHKHWCRWRRHGDASVVHERRRKTYESAESRIARLSKPDGDCIVFTGGRPQRSGHRMISYNGVLTGVHRVAFQLVSGSIPPGKVVMHRCDNPPCVKRSHLRLGTVADNNRDRDLKGRHRPLRGSTNGHARLSEWQVAEMKVRLERGESTYRLADEYGVCQAQVWRIKSGAAWRHVNPADWPLGQPDLRHPLPGAAAAKTGAGRGPGVTVP